MNSKITDIQGVLYLIKRHSLMMALLCGLSVAASCGKKASPNSTPKEDTRAKELLQGIWLNEDDEDVAFRVKGDTIYYPDSTSQPVYFCIYGDTLVMKGARDVKYPILKQAAHLFEFKSPSGDVIKLTKTSDKTYLKSFQQEKTIALNQNQLIKRDTIVLHVGNRYHLYVQVNPTTYKVFKSSMNDDGVQVDNVYFDNIINLNVFHGANKLFSHDFKKKDFGKKVPDSFLEQAVLSDLLFEGIDEKGIHYLAVLAMPDSSLSYQVKIVVSYQGKLKILSV
nr:DUF4738 domain-containing protein [uncultured Prevotella sp.]